MISRQDRKPKGFTVIVFDLVNLCLAGEEKSRIARRKCTLTALKGEKKAGGRTIIWRQLVGFATFG